jgi:hypothetical protein
MLIFILLISLGLVNCAGSDNISTTLDQEFTLSIGQSASIIGENLRISLKNVIDDSRCPEGAACIWEGEASCLVEITYSGAVSNKVLIQPGVSGTSEAHFGDYVIIYNLTPYPKVGKEIKKEEYRLHLNVNKEPELISDVPATFKLIM